MYWKRFWNESAQVRDPDFYRQVGRTFHKIPYSESQVQHLVDALLSHLPRDSGASLLDVACGNGMITSRLASHFAHVTGVDYSEPLIGVARQHFSRDNIEYVIAEAEHFLAPPASYDCAVVCLALQHFSISQVRALLRRLTVLLKPGAPVALAEVPDGDRLWNFYRGLSGRVRYAVDVIRNRPIIGYWWRPTDLHRLALEAGMSLSIHYQPVTCPNHYFRYDAVLRVASSIADSHA